MSFESRQDILSFAPCPLHCILFPPCNFRSYPTCAFLLSFFVPFFFCFALQSNPSHPLLHCLFGKIFSFFFFCSSLLICLFGSLLQVRIVQSAVCLALPSLHLLHLASSYIGRF